MMKTVAVPREAGPQSPTDTSTPSNEQVGGLRYLLVAVQLALVLGVALTYRLELERGFAVVAWLMLIGFLIHSWLPLRARLPFFLMLSLIAIGLLLRTDGLWLLVIGISLIGLCHLPVTWSIRVSLLLVTGLCLAALRAGLVDIGLGDPVLPVLAAIFMFRLILYVYDLKEERTPASISQRLSYFFLLPNVCFPLFPVIDYKTFLRTYYDAPAADIYQKGVFWMFRGVTHLLLYRLIYFLLPRAEDLTGILGVYVFIAMTYALYLRVSGLFHLIVGSLCLFGFNLPVTNNHYFLASSFNDLWRRINIYWKDFMMTTAFYPVFMGTRRLGMAARIAIATGFVFLITWLLHSYQWFWLQGVFPVAATDILFWGILGVGLALNSVWEARQGRRRVVRAAQWSGIKSFGITLRTMGVFSFMALLWSLWNSSSVEEWAHRLLRVAESGTGDLAVFCGLAVAALIIGIGVSWLNARGGGPIQAEELVRRHASLVVPVMSIGLILMSLPSVYYRIGGRVQVVAKLAQSTGLNTIDRRRQERGYYEELSRATQLGAGNALGIGSGSPFGDAAEWESIGDTPAAMETDDIRGISLRPNMEIAYHGATLRTNRWGLRDHDYEKGKSPDYYRAALIGPSSAMGAGVDDDETFENLFENELNRSPFRQVYERLEVLNLSVGGYGVLDVLYVIRNVAPQFTPDAVMYVAHPGESYRMFDRLRRRLVEDADLHVETSTRLVDGYEPVLAILRESEASSDLPTDEFHRRLAPYSDQTLVWAYREMIEACERMGAKFVLLLVPMPGDDFTQAEREMLMRITREAGGEVLDLSGTFDGYEPREIKVAEWDDHPNELGHRLIATALYAEFTARARELGLSQAYRGANTPATSDN